MIPHVPLLSGLFAGARIATARRLLTLGLAATLFFFIYQQHRFRGLTDPAAMEHAQLGRSLAEGRGYQTRFLRPIVMHETARRQAGKTSWSAAPELMRPPLYPAALAFAFRLLRPDFTVDPQARAFAPETRVIIPLGWLCTLATAMLLILTANRFFDRRIAVMAPLVFLLSHTVLQRTLSGLPDPLATLLAAAAFGISLGCSRRSTQPAAGTLRPFVFPAAAAGILTAAAVLCDYSLILFAPAPFIACCLAPPRRRGMIAAVFMIALLAVLIPWFTRNACISGHPFGLAHLTWLRNTTFFPGNRLDRALSWNPDALRIGALLRARLTEGLFHAGWFERWLSGGDAVFPALALLALFTPGSHRGIRLLRYSVIPAAVLLLAVDPLLAPHSPGRLIYPLAPWIILLGCAGLIGALDRAAATRIARRIACSAAVLLHAVPVFAGLFMPREPLPYPPLYPPFVAAACALVNNEELMVSDMPWATAWYGNQRTLWLPNTLEEFYTVNDHHQTVAALYLTTETTSRPYARDLLDGEHRDWLPFIEGNLPAGFPLTEGLRLPAGGRDQLLLIGPGRLAAESLVE